MQIIKQFYLPMRQTFITIIICLVILTGVNLVYSYGPPPGSPPDCPIDYPGCATPINVSTTAQTFVGSKILKVGSLGNGSLGINGALTVNGLGIFNSNVGIGTTNPGTKLDVNGNISLGSRIFPGALGTESGYSLVHFRGGTDTAGGIVRASKGTDDLANAPLRFEASSFTFGGNVSVGGNVSANQFCLPGANPTGGCISTWPTGGGYWTLSGANIYNTNTGNVGIGTAGPAATLDVARGTASSGTAVFRGTNNWSHFNYSTSENTYIRGGKPTSGVIINDTASGYVTLATGGGNVGIGTLSPGAKLEVAGQVKITGGSPGNAKVLTSDANGLASWQTVTSGVTRVTNSVYATCGTPYKTSRVSVYCPSGKKVISCELSQSNLVPKYFYNFFYIDSGISAYGVNSIYTYRVTSGSNEGCELEVNLSYPSLCGLNWYVEATCL